MKKILSLLSAFLIILTCLPAYSAPSVIVIVNKANPLNEISARQLKNIFRTEKTFWDNGKKIILVLPSPDTPESRIFNSAIYEMNYSELKKFWFIQIFNNKISSPPKTFNNDSEIIKFVSINSGAVGYISKENINASVKILKIDNSENINQLLSDNKGE